MPRGRPPKNNMTRGSERTVTKKTKETQEPKVKEKVPCFFCGKEYTEKHYYTSYSAIFNRGGKIPCCNNCIEKHYQYFYEQFKEVGSLNPERGAIKRVCMSLDIFFSNDVFVSAMKKIDKNEMSSSPMTEYMKILQLRQYSGKSYDATALAEEKESFALGSTDVSDSRKVGREIMEFFGAGFTDEDYEFLHREYQDWIARHECNTKAQEEVFKRLCFKQLEILKATRRGDDTKNLDATFQDLLDTAKLKPKQNAGDTTADNQTFGTLIDKWENERPLPEIDEELKDVDKIALYINIFFKGHLSKMMGLKNGLSSLYSKYMKKYTVERPEYDGDENSEALFDAVFGGDLKDE